MTKLEQIAKEIADIVCPVIESYGGGEIRSSNHPVVEGLVMELALEIKRATTEGEW